MPLFFVAGGASVDLSRLDPFQPASRFALIMGGVLIVAGVAGKIVRLRRSVPGNKTVIGVGNGALAARSASIFAQMGLATLGFRRGSLLVRSNFAVIVTTLMAPPCLKLPVSCRPDPLVDWRQEGIEELVTEAREVHHSHPLAPPDLVVRMPNLIEFRRHIWYRVCHRIAVVNQDETAPNESATVLRGCTSGRDHAIMSNVRGQFAIPSVVCKTRQNHDLRAGSTFQRIARGPGRRWRREWCVVTKTGKRSIRCAFCRCTGNSLGR